MRSVEEVLSDLGIREFSSGELVEIGEKYKKALLNGLEGKSELSMYPSYLHPVDPQTLPEGKAALVIELGGTHIYAGIVKKTEKGIVLVESYQTGFPTRVYQSAEHFFTLVSDRLTPLLDHVKPDTLAIVYSHPAHNIPAKVGNEAVIESLSKEFIVPGITQEPLGAQVRKYFGTKYPYLLDLPTVSMNDTVAVLLSCGALVGGVVATGFNLAVATPQGIANTESGDFEGLPASTAYDEINRASKRPGHHAAEKRLSGMYLPEYFRIAVRELQKEGYRVELPQPLTGATLSGFLLKPAESENDKLYQRLSRILMNQSAQIVGELIGMALAVFHADAPPQLKIPVEGSFFWGMPGYTDEVRRVAEKASTKTINFVKIPDAGRIGAGVSALGTLGV